MGRVSVGRRGFTIIELLIVITIIGILISLFIPAVQAAREASRRAQCMNHLRQLGMACLNHESQMKHLPTDGWGNQWAGDPDRGAGVKQPGGWLFNILPYTEQSALYGTTAAMTYGTPKQLAAFTTMCATPVTMMYCPSRREAKAYPYTWRPMANNKTTTFFNQSTGCFWDGGTGPKTAVAKNDYAGNGGQYYMTSKYPQGGALMCSFGGPSGFTTTHPSPYDLFDQALANKTIIQDGSTYWSATVPDGLATFEAGADGIFDPFSHVTVPQISDGTTNTYLCGEKSLPADKYETGDSFGDNQCAYMGHVTDIVRFAEDSTGFDGSGSEHGIVHSPVRDAADLKDICVFGSPHPYGVNMCFCDGSARLIGFGIDSAVHARLCNRKDGAVVDMSELDR
jgi:prepilin-type N-terminal cleavage/methylation domain-containing protein/prepilin-type processing-associated H-X9-DG protein